MPLTEDRATVRKGTELLAVGVAGSTKLFGGGMVSVNAAGYAIPAVDTAATKMAGVSEAQVDNTDGIDGDKQAIVRRGKVYIFDNSAANPVTLAHLFTDVFVEDDETVASSTTNNIVAGECVGVDALGVHVRIG